MSTHNVRICTIRDLNFVVALQKKFSNQIGFIPRMAVEEYLEASRVLIVEENDEPAGYVLGRRSMRYDRSIRPITQAAIAMDAQRRHLGMAVVERVCLDAASENMSMVQCWCAKDLDAQSFWPAVGFVAVGERSPANARGRSLTLWRRALVPLDNGRLLVMPPVAGYIPRKVA